MRSKKAPTDLGRQASLNAKAGKGLSRAYDNVDELIADLHAAAARFPVVPSTPAERRALKRARREYRAGQTITLDQYEQRRRLKPGARPPST